MVEYKKNRYYPLDDDDDKIQLFKENKFLISYYPRNGIKQTAN